MEVITRGDVSSVTLLWQRGPGWVLTVVCKAVFELKPGEAGLLGDPAEPSDRDVAWEPPFGRTLRAINDLVPVKPRVDVIVTGHAYAPGDVPVRSLRTRLAIGAVDKSIEVTADRYFDRNGALVEGPPFARLPLVYELAAGGPGTWNPAGIAVGSLDGRGRLALPNLVPPGAAVPTPDAPFVPPIGYGPLPADWPSRVEKLGRRSPRDLPADWHGAPLPDDFPRDYFNAAPDDQQLDALPEDLTMTLENLIPGHPLLTCWLPAICPTILCEAALGTSSVVPSIDTVHIDTDAVRCSVVWRGHLPRRDAAADLRVLVSLENPRARRSLRVAGGAGEHARVVPPPLPQGPISTPRPPDPPTFAGTGEHPRVVAPTFAGTGEHPRVVAPTFSGTGEHPRVVPPTFSGTGEHPRVVPPPLPQGPISAPRPPDPPMFSGTGEHPRVALPPLTPTARPPLPTAPFVEPEPPTFGVAEPPRAVPPARKSEPTALFTVPEAPRAAPPARKSEPTALYTTSDLARSVQDRRSQPTGVFEVSAASLARLTEIEADPEPQSEEDPYEAMGLSSRDTIAPGLINPVDLPFPVPRPTPDGDSDPDAEADSERWGSTIGARTGVFPWGITPASTPTPPAAVPPAQASQSQAVPPSRPAQSGQTLPPAPMPSPVQLPSSAELRAPPVSAGLRAEVSVPAAPPPLPPTFPRTDPPPEGPMHATPIPAAPFVAAVALAAAETGNLSSTDQLWGTGPSGAKGETIGMSLRSGAGSLALAEPRYAAGFVDEPTPPPEPARSPLLLLWFDPESVVRIRRAPQWKALLDELEKQPLDRDLESEGGTREPWELEDRRDVFEICARGRTTTGRGCEEALSGARGKAGKVVPPVVLVEGELEIQLDELEALKAAATTVAPVVSPPDEGLRAALEATDTFLRRQGLSAAPAVCEGLQMRLREAFLRDKRALPPDYVERQVERALLTGRHYQRRDVFGGPFFRAILRVTGEKDGLVVYLPEALHRKVPMFRRFPVRAIADVHPHQDPYETRPLALRVLALARST